MRHTFLWENIILEAFLTFFFIFIPLCEFFSLFAYIPTKCKRPLLLLPDRSIDARRIKKTGKLGRGHSKTTGTKMGLFWKVYAT